MHFDSHERLSNFSISFLTWSFVKRAGTNFKISIVQFVIEIKSFIFFPLFIFEQNIFSVVPLIITDIEEPEKVSKK